MIYAYRCNQCDREKLEQRAVKHMLTKLPKCDQCGRRMKFFISSPPLAIVKNPAAGYRP